MPSCAIYHTLSKKKIHKIVRKRRCRGNGGSDKMFLHKLNIEEQSITIYIDSNLKLPYIELISKRKMVVLP